MQRLNELIPNIPPINTALPYSEFLQMKADTYNATQGSLKGFDCPICKNKGYIEKIVNEDEVLAQCKCLKTRDTLRRIHDSGMEELLRRCTFKNFECTEKWQETLKNSAQKFAEQDSGSFFIGGQSGCGKTHLCTAIVGTMIKRGRSARYFVWREMSVILKGAVNDQDYTQMMDDFKKTDVLYIDDLFKQNNINDADIKLAFELIDYRVRTNRMTVISTEMDLNRILDIDEALGGRIIQAARGNKYIIAKDRGKNYRLKE